MPLLPLSPEPDRGKDGHFPKSKEHQEWLAASIRQAAMLRTYLKSLDKNQLDRVLKEVLSEIRSRDTEEMKTDVLTHSKSLQYKNGTLGLQTASRP